MSRFGPTGSGRFGPVSKVGRFWPDIWGESFRPDFFILGKQVRYYVEFTLLTKVTKVMYLILLMQLRSPFLSKKFRLLTVL